MFADLNQRFVSNFVLTISQMENTNDNILLTSAEVMMIQTTWDLVSGSIQTVINFYNQLFYNYPDLRQLFNEDICFQAKLFNDTMSQLVKNIENWGAVVPSLNSLGRRHSAYNVRPEHYEIMHKWLLQEMKNAIPNEWSAEAEKAWSKFILKIATAMLDSK